MRQELITVKVSRPAGVLWESSVGLVVIKFLLERNGKKKKTRLLYLVIYKQRKKVDENIENECIIYGMRWECLRLRSNTLHAKFAVFSITRDLPTLCSRDINLVTKYVNEVN